jgi:hypothetical protein
MEVLSEDEDDEIIAAIDRGIEDADEGRSVSLDEARELVCSTARLRRKSSRGRQRLGRSGRGRHESLAAPSSSSRSLTLAASDCGSRRCQFRAEIPQIASH